MNLNISESSAAAYGSISQIKRKNLQDEILDVFRLAHGRGVGDLSGQELRRALEERLSLAQGRAVRVDVSSLTSPISRLICAGRLQRLVDKRPCSITQQNIHALRMPMTQSRLVA